MKIGEVVKRTGLTRRTIRFYTEKGLINPAVHENNGRDYRDYSEKDVQELLSIAQLRKALFSIEQIHRIKTAPGDIPEVLGDYYRKLKDAGERIATLIHTAQNLDRDAVTDMQSLSGAFEKAAKSMPLPEADRNPRFGRLDSPEFAESPEVQEFHENQYKEKAQFLPPTLHLNRSALTYPSNVFNFGTMTGKVFGKQSKRSALTILIVSVICIALLFGIAAYVSANRELQEESSTGNKSSEYYVHYTDEAGLSHNFTFAGYTKEKPEDCTELGQLERYVNDPDFESNLYTGSKQLEGCTAFLARESHDRLVLYVYAPEISGDYPWMALR